MPKTFFAFLIILLFFSLSFFTINVEAQVSGSALAEFQIFDIGSPWLGGQLIFDTSLEIPGRKIQPDNISLSYVFKSQGYTGRLIRGFLNYDMGGDVYSGLGVGWIQVGSGSTFGPISGLLGALKSGLNISLFNLLQLRGEFLAYIPLWHLMNDEQDQQSIFFAVNIGFGF